MAVTRWRLSFSSSTVRQTPLWERLWSTFSSEVREDSTQKVLLVPLVSMECILPSDSIIPVNMGQISGFCVEMEIFDEFCGVGGF